MDKEPSSVLLDARDATISKTVSPPRHRQRAPSSAKGCEPPILLGLAFWCAVHHPWAYLRRYRRFQGFAASTSEALVDVPADHPTGAGGATAKVTVFAALGGKAPRQPAQPPDPLARRLQNHIKIRCKSATARPEPCVLARAMRSGTHEWPQLRLPQRSGRHRVLLQLRRF